MNQFAYECWAELIEDFKAERICVDTHQTDPELMKGFMETLNSEGLFFRSLQWGEMPYNRYLYYSAGDKYMYTTGGVPLADIYGRKHVSLNDCRQQNRTILTENLDSLTSLL